MQVDDTVPGLLKGRRADCWAVAVVASGNEMGLTRAQWTALSQAERRARCQAAKARLHEVRPDCFVDTAAELLAVLDGIEARLTAGGRPHD